MTIKKTLVLVVSLLSSLVWSFTALADAGKFEFGRLTVSNCFYPTTSSECTIQFKNTYSQPPLVFLMPTIEKSNTNPAKKTTDLPSSLRVMNVSSTSADIRQFLAPSRNKSTSTGVIFNKAPMVKIDYFVIEPGVIKLSNGTQIIAGRFDTKKTVHRTDGHTFQRINFSDFGLPRFVPITGSSGQLPGVLTQIQSTNNVYSSESRGHYIQAQPEWMTSVVKNVSLTSFKYAIELSETKDHTITENETVAFVAGMGRGYIDGKKFWLGSGKTADTNGSNERIYKPVIDECQAYSNIEATFDSAPILIASKNTRDGNDGGWLRRCDLQADKVSFVIEEDMDSDKERGHKAETVGYFIFENQQKPQICSLFPSPAQTWLNNRNESLYIANSGQIIGASLVDQKRFVGFSSTAVTDLNKQGCEGTECFGEPGLMVTKLPLEDFQAPTVPELEIVNINSGRQEFKSSERIGSLYVENGAKAIFYSGTYWIDSLNIIGDIEVPAGQNVIINTKGFALSSDSSFVATDTATLDVVVYDLPFTYTTTIFPDRIDLAQNSLFTGLLYSEKNVALSNGSTVEGAVTARQIEIHNDAKIVGAGSCFEPPIDDELILKPMSGSGLSCTGVDFSLSVQSESTQLPSDFVGDIRVDLHHHSQIGACIVPKGTIPSATCGDVGSEKSFTFSYPAEKDLTLFSKRTGSVYLNASAVSDTNLQVTRAGPYQFLAQGFTLDSQYDVDKVNGGQIAKRPYGLTVKAVSSGENSLSCDPIDNYTAEDVPLHFSRKAAGDELVGHYQINGTSIQNNTPISVDFNQGFATTNLTAGYTEAQQVGLSVSGPSVCNDQGCETGTLMSSNSLSLYHRPFSFALCHAKSQTQPLPYGTSVGGRGLTFSGAAIDFSVKALPWLPNYGDQTSGAIKAPNMDPNNLSGYETYVNHFCSQPGLLAFSGDVTLNHTIHSPASGDAGTLNTSAIIFDQGNNQSSVLGQLSWDNVGSLLLSPIHNNYLTSGLNVPPAGFILGRIYPNYFSIVDNNTGWTYPSGQTDFAYMGQPFIHRFNVEARNSAGRATSNYGAFNTHLKGSIAMMAVDPTAVDMNDLSARIENIAAYAWDGSFWQGATLSQTISDFTFSRAEQSASPLITREDGPFDESNQRYGLYVSQTVDSVDFNTTDLTLTRSDNSTERGQSYTSHARVRYGRMALGDVIGQSGDSLDVPLRVEFWNGDRFVNNSDDSQSYFTARNVGLNENYICTETVWQSSEINSNSHLVGSGAVIRGEAQNLQAVADSNSANLREKVRFWLRITNMVPSGITCQNPQRDAAQPWLQYNWRGLGDEDPSAMVTFGLFRGHDRIIFRGESNVISTVN